MSGSKSPFIKSLINLNVDYSGTFFQGLKRYRAAKRVLTNLNLLNRIRPRELADFMIQRRQLPRSKAGRLLILRRAFNLVVGVKQGNVKAFYKRLHSQLGVVTRERQDRIIRSVVCKLDLFLCNLKLFESNLEAQNYIKHFGVFINDVLVFNPRRVLGVLDVVSFLQEHRCFFKTRFYHFFSGSLYFISHYEKFSRFFSNLLIHKHNLFNFNFINSGFGNTISHEALVGAGQSVLGGSQKLFVVTNGVTSLLGAPLYQKKLIAFALAFRKRKWIKRWRNLQGVGHPDNLRRLAQHRLSVNPYAVDALVKRLISRVRRVCSREFWYIFPKLKGRWRSHYRHHKARKYRVGKVFSSWSFLNLQETSLRRLKRNRYFRQFRKRKHRHYYRRKQKYQRFHQSQRSGYSSLGQQHQRSGRWQKHPKRWYRSKKLRCGVRGFCVRLAFEKNFINSFVRILSWRLRKLRYCALLARLESRLPVSGAKEGCVYRLLSPKTVFAHRAFKFFSFASLHLAKRLQSLVPEGFIGFNGKFGIFNLLFFKDGFRRRIRFSCGLGRYATVATTARNRSFVRVAATKRIVFRGFRWWQNRPARRVAYKRACLPKGFACIIHANFGRFIPKTVISKLKYSLPWYERDPFSRSKYFRFYRLHPRFSSIFFPNFLPRFVEPSLKAFEFLIRPILLKPFDLRLPFTVRKGVRLSLLMSLV